MLYTFIKSKSISSWFITNLYYVFSEAVRSFERFTTEFAGVAATAKVCGGRIAAGLQFVIVLLRRQGVGGASVDVVVVVIVGSGVGGAVGNGFGLVPSPV